MTRPICSNAFALSLALLLSSTVAPQALAREHTALSPGELCSVKGLQSITYTPLEGIELVMEDEWEEMYSYWISVDQNFVTQGRRPDTVLDPADVILPVLIASLQSAVMNPEIDIKYFDSEYNSTYVQDRPCIHTSIYDLRLHF